MTRSEAVATFNAQLAAHWEAERAEILQVAEAVEEAFDEDGVNNRQVARIGMALRWEAANLGTVVS